MAAGATMRGSIDPEMFDEYTVNRALPEARDYTICRGLWLKNEYSSSEAQEDVSESAYRLRSGLFVLAVVSLVLYFYSWCFDYDAYIATGAARLATALLASLFAFAANAAQSHGVLSSPSVYTTFVGVSGVLLQLASVLTTIIAQDFREPLEFLFVLFVYYGLIPGIPLVVATINVGGAVVLLSFVGTQAQLFPDALEAFAVTLVLATGLGLFYLFTESRRRQELLVNEITLMGQMRANQVFVDRREKMMNSLRPKFLLTAPPRRPIRVCDIPCVIIHLGARAAPLQGLSSSGTMLPVELIQDFDELDGLAAAYKLVRVSTYYRLAILCPVTLEQLDVRDCVHFARAMSMRWVTSAGVIVDDVETFRLEGRGDPEAHVIWGPQLVLRGSTAQSRWLDSVLSPSSR